MRLVTKVCDKDTTRRHAGLSRDASIPASMLNKILTMPTSERRDCRRSLQGAIGRRRVNVGATMGYRVLVLYGSYRSDRMGIRLAQFIIEGLRARNHEVELIDARAIGLPMLDRMYKEHPKGEAPEKLEKLARQIRGADGFVFITGEYNWGIQPGLKNLT